MASTIPSAAASRCVGHRAAHCETAKPRVPCRRYPRRGVLERHDVGWLEAVAELFEHA